MIKRVPILLFLLNCHPIYTQATFCRNSISAAWENDLFNGHDYYYTNGIRLSLYQPIIRFSPVARILLPNRDKDQISCDGLHLRQEIYTPRDLEADSVLPEDHPYGATLSLVESKTVFIPESGLRYRTALRIGVMGPAALGLFVQNLAHRISNPSRPPRGWAFQIQNDLILNYSLSLDKQLAGSEVSGLDLSGGFRIGTLHTDFSGGLRVRVDPGGRAYEGMGPDPSGSFVWLATFGGTGKYVVYDATLQGGLFNSDSPDVIPGSSVIRWIPEVNAGIELAFQKHVLYFYEMLNGPVFEGSAWHSWMGIEYAYWW